MDKKSVIFGCMLGAFLPSAYSLQSPFELSLGVGPSWFTANDATLQTTSIEYDKALVNNVSAGAVKKIGIGYHLSPSLFQSKYLSDVLVELNYYHVTGAINGEVWLGGDSNYPYWTFRAPLSSSRLMLDVKPALYNNQNFSAYPIVGAGVAWNKLAFNESTTFSGAESQSAYTTLASGVNRRVSYDLGLGMRYQLAMHLSTSMEYLFNQQGKFTSSQDSNDGRAVLSAPSFLTRSQNVLWNVSWQF